MTMLNAANNNPFAGSQYYGKVDFDFEGLPDDIANVGVLRQFEPRTFMNHIEMADWRNNWERYLRSIPSKYTILVIKKAIEYAKITFDYHIENECRHKICLLNEPWQRRIDYAEEILLEHEPQIPIYSGVEYPELQTEHKEFTTARQVLAMHFILEQLQVRSNEIDRKAKADLVQFFTAKNHKNIYDAFQDPFITKDKNFRFDDLNYIRTYFEKLGLSEIVKAINNQLDKPR